MRREGVWELPSGWDIAPLGRLVDVQSGFACSKKNLVSASMGVAHLRPFNVGTDGKVDLSEVYYVPPDFKDNVENYALEPGHILFNNTNSVELVGKTALVTQPMSCAFSNHIYRLTLQERAKKRLEPAWLALALRRLWAMGYFAEQCNRWIGQAGFNATKLKEVEIPLPSLDEQQRIVGRIEALFERIAEARRLRVTAEEDTERLTMAVLAETFWGQDVGQWTSQSIAEIAEVKGGKRLPKGESFSSSQTPYPYLRVVDFSNGTIDRANIRYLTSEIYSRISRYTISKDDVYISIAGTIGLVGVVPDDLDGSNLTENAARIVFRERSKQAIDKHFLVYFLQSPLGRTQIDERSKAAGQPKLALVRIRTIEVSYPPLSEQRRIVDYLDGVQAQGAELKRLQAASAAELERLGGAVLDRAFRGEL